jgi:streptogramin lyase
VVAAACDAEMVALELTDESPPVATADVGEGDSCASEWTSIRCITEERVDSSGVRSCLVGTRRCRDGAWGPCEDLEAVTEGDEGPPGVERQGVLGARALCGGCDAACYVTHDCPSSADEGNPDIVFDGVRFDAVTGGVVIGNPSKSAPSRFAWVSSYGQDVVNKLNLETLENDGVYRVGDNPSRTALDSQGYVYVGNRNSGDITKLAGELSQCVETNGTPGIQTSAGETSPGVFNLLGPNSDPATRDECIIWQRRVGPGGGSPKALVIDSRGRLWVGLNNTRQYYVMDTKTGDTLYGPIATTDTPYGAAIGPDGKLWSASTSNSIQPIDTNSAIPSALDVGVHIHSPGDVYGIAVDGKNRVIVASGSDLSRYDPATGAWQTEDTSGARGVTVDANSKVYVCGNGANAIIEHDPNDLDETRRWTVNKGPYGCSPDFVGRIWAANNGSSNTGVVDLDTGTVTYIRTYGTNYTYSDFLGYGFAMFTNPSGYLIRTYDSVDTCGIGIPALHDDLLVDVSTPDTTSIEFRARVADDLPGLDSAVEVYLGSTPFADGRIDLSSALIAAGQNPRRRFLRIRVSLLRNGSSQSPVFRSMDLVEYCG